MPIIKKIGVQNLRGLEQTGLIEIKPITLLVGKNSAGKSSFARIFPLLKQSSEAKRNAPFLWWGQYVDYGTFSQALRRGASPQEMCFSFEVTLNAGVILKRPRYASFRIPKLHSTTSLIATITVKETEGKSYSSRVTLSLFDLVGEIEMDRAGNVTKIGCGNAVWAPNINTGAFVSQGEYLPDILFTQTVEEEVDGKTRKYRTLAEFNPLERLLSNWIRSQIHGNNSAGKIAEIAQRIPLAPPDETLSYLKNNRKLTSSWEVLVKKLTIDSPILKACRELAFLEALPGIAQSANDSINSFATSVRYLGPIRATAQRFYRPQELSISEMDPRGENLAVLLNDLQNKYNFSAFNSWLKNSLGFEVLAAKEGSQIELKIKFEDAVTPADAINLADVGFGVSQVLPIATQIWLAASDKRLRAAPGSHSSCIVVEQPELHLHPAFQARLADLFVNAVTSNPESTEQSLNIIAETHSSSLINRVGELIAEKKISPNDVQVLLFEQEFPSAPAKIVKAYFDDEGVLKNWPFGFFSAGAYE